MSEHESDAAAIERELVAIEHALESGAVTSDDPVPRELQELALALRADAPKPAAAFAQHMDERVRAGFSQDRRRRMPSLPSGRLLPALGVATMLLVAIVVVTFTAGDPNRDNGFAGGGGGMAEPGREAVEAGGGSGASADAGPVESSREEPEPLAAPAPPGGGGFAPGRRDRRIERSIALELEAPADDMARVADGVTAVTNRHGGFVLSSSLSTGDDGSAGEYELRIPVDRLQAALRELSELAVVRSQSQSGRDVTRDFVTARDRLQAARAERRSLLRRLENADTDEEAEALRVRLDIVAGEINGLRASLRDLRIRTDYAVVTVTLGEADDNGGGSGGTGSFDDSLDDAGDLLVGFAGVLVRVLALAVPLGLIAAAGWVAGRALRRRRRESVLA